MTETRASPSAGSLSLPFAASIYDINTLAAPAGLNSSLQMCDRLALRSVSREKKIFGKKYGETFGRGREVRERSASICFFFNTVTEETAEPLHPNLLLYIYFFLTAPSPFLVPAQMESL